MTQRRHVQGERRKSKRAQGTGSQEKKVYQRRRCDQVR